MPPKHQQPAVAQAPPILAGTVLLGLAALYFFVPLVLSAATKETFLVPKEAVARGIIGLTLLAWTVLLAVSGRLLPLRVPLAPPLLALTALALASALWAPSAAVAMLDAFSVLLFVLLYLCLYQRFANRVGSTSGRDALLLIALGVGVITAAIGLLQFLGLQPLAFFEFVGDENRKQVFSTFGNPNMLAAYLVPLILLALAIYLADDRGAVRWASSRAAVLMALVVVVTGTRSAWLGLAVGLGVLLLSGSPDNDTELVRKRRLLLHGLLLALAIGAVVTFGSGKEIEPLAQRLRSLVEGGGHGGQSRLMQWRIAAAMFGDNPVLGLGLGGFKLEFLDYRARFFDDPANAGYLVEVAASNAKRAHNEVLQVGAELGVVGLGVVIWALVAIVVSARRRLRELEKRSRDSVFMRREWLWRRGMAAGLVALAVDGQFAFPLHVAATAALAMLLLAGLLAPVERDAVVAGETPGDGGSGRGAGAFALWAQPALAAALAVAAILVSARVVGAEVFLKSAEKALLEAQNVERAAQLAGEGLLQNPFDGRLHFVAALAEQQFATQARQRGQERAAREALGRAVASYERADRYFGDVAIPANSGQSYLGLGDPQSALVQLDRARRMDPTSKPVLLMMAVATAMREGPAAGVEWLRRARNLDAGDTAVGLMYHRFQGQAKASSGSINRAVEHYRQGLALAPGDPELLLGLAHATALLGEVDEAHSVLLGLTQQMRGWPPAHALLARVEARRGDLAAAERNARVVLAADPSNADMRQLVSVLEARRQTTP